MPLVDMPLAELKKYQGRTPCPKDFDQYWSRALAELDNCAPEVDVQQADFQVPFALCQHLFFRGVGGSRIHAKYLRPLNPSQTKHPAVLIFHGYTGGSPDWSSLLGWVAAGYSVFAMDARGQGGLSENRESVSGTTYKGLIIRGLSDGPNKLVFRNIYLDTVRLARLAMQSPEVDPNRIGCLGASQGGALTLACASLEPRIKRAAPTYPFLCDFQRVWEMDEGGEAYSELVHYFRRFDPNHQREAEFFRILGYIDLQNLAGRIQAKVLLGCGLMDTTCLPSTQFAMYNKIQSEKDVAIYPDFKHENLPGFESRVYQFMMGL